MRIAFYLNLQGAGHCRRFEAIAPYLPPESELAVIGMGGQPPISNIGRPVKRIAVPGFGMPSSLPFLQQQTSHDYHDFMVNHGGNAPFCQALVSFFSDWTPDLLIVDVGLEASVLARLCGVPTLYSRQHGQRWDKGHKLAYEWAMSLLAPFVAEMEQSNCPDWIREKTIYSGGFSRFAVQEKSAHPPISYANDKPNILVMTGFGGTDMTAQKFSEAAIAMPQWQWHFVGAQAKLQAGQSLSDNVCYHGVVKDIWPYLCHADLVVSNAGHNATMEIATAGAPALFIPAERPFAEQHCKADVLNDLGLGVVSPHWPEPSTWSTIYQRSHEPDRMRWQRIQSPESARLAAQHIAQIAQQCLKPMAQPPVVVNSLTAA